MLSPRYHKITVIPWHLATGRCWIIMAAIWDNLVFRQAERLGPLRREPSSAILCWSFCHSMLQFPQAKRVGEGTAGPCEQGRSEK